MGFSPSGANGRGTSKLDPFREQIRQRVDKDLTATRILREIRQLGYDGGRTIVAERVRELRAELGLGAHKQVKRRFETEIAEEMQVDWSPYTVSIAGRRVKVHALGCLLCACRKHYVRFYRDERQSTLLEGLASAFEYFEGCAMRLVLDNMATAILGRIGPDRKELWHPRFAAFAAHYGFTPFACAVRDPDRKGKKEKCFRLVWDDFLKGTEFASWQDLDEQRMIWLDKTPGVANLRVHGTTRRVPNEAWLSERDLLIRLPEERFPVYESSVRIVDQDSTLSINGTPYTVPSSLAKRSVAVHLFAEHFEVLNSHGHVAFSRRYVADDDKGKLQIDHTHYAPLPRRPRGDGRRLDEAFRKRFPDLEPFLSGLKRKMKSLTAVHIRRLVRLVDRYGEEAFLAAAHRAQDYRRYDALAVERILERNHPLVEQGDVMPLSGIGPLVLGEVESGSLDTYAELDAKPPSAPSPDSFHSDDEEIDHGP
jgi:transposase